MKISAGLLLLVATVAFGDVITPEQTTAYGYLAKIGIPEAERIRKAEEAFLNDPSRITGGVQAIENQFPWQAGLLIDMVGLDGNGVCGASLVSANRLVTAAHCWHDGIHQAWRFTVVLGSVRLFSGGTRVQTTEVIMHPQWQPSLIRNDVAMILLPVFVPLSASIAPIRLPSGSEVNEDFSNEVAIASGFGRTGDSDDGHITLNQALSHVSLRTLPNSSCRIPFLGLLQDTNVCTSGADGKGPCGGDSGGPLYVVRDGRPVLVGIVSFGSILGCESFMPAAYARVTSFQSFIESYL